MSTTVLTMGEGVLLAHALVARVAEQVGARVLFIKGPTAVAVGARPERPSTDVDVLVDPAAFDSLCAALEVGWTKRFGPLPVERAADLAFDHSAHFTHRTWPNDIDVHFNFPGFLAEPTDVFEALWSTRTTLTLAGRDVLTPALPGHCLVVALHALRDPGTSRSRADLAHVGRALSALGYSDIQALVGLARRTGSLETAASVLPRGGWGAGAPSSKVDAQLAAWRVRQEFGDVPGAMWLVELRRARWRHRPAVIARAIFPPQHALLTPHLAARATTWDLAVLHLGRWAKGVRSLPRAMGILRKLRSG